jgi:hypothetical protein
LHGVILTGHASNQSSPVKRGISSYENLKMESDSESDVATKRSVINKDKDSEYANIEIKDISKNLLLQIVEADHNIGNTEVKL